MRAISRSRIDHTQSSPARLFGDASVLELPADWRASKIHRRLQHLVLFHPDRSYASARRSAVRTNLSGGDRSNVSHFSCGGAHLLSNAPPAGVFPMSHITLKDAGVRPPIYNSHSLRLLRPASLRRAKDGTPTESLHGLTMLIHAINHVVPELAD